MGQHPRCVACRAASLEAQNAKKRKRPAADVLMCRFGCGRRATNQSKHNARPSCRKCRLRLERQRAKRAQARAKHPCAECGRPVAKAAKLCVRCHTSKNNRCAECRRVIVSAPGDVCPVCAGTSGPRRAYTCKGKVGRHECSEKTPHSHCRGDGTGRCGLIIPAGALQCEGCKLDQGRRERRLAKVA